MPPSDRRLSKELVDLRGFEPLQTEPKSVVLPLHHRSKWVSSFSCVQRYQRIFAFARLLLLPSRFFLPGLPVWFCTDRETFSGLYLKTKRYGAKKAFRSVPPPLKYGAGTVFRSRPLLGGVYLDGSFSALFFSVSRQRCTSRVPSRVPCPGRSRVDPTSRT